MNEPEFDIDANQPANHEDGTYHRELDPNDSQFEVLPSGEPAEGLVEAIDEAFQSEVDEVLELSNTLDGLRAHNARMLTPAERKASQKAQQDAEKLKATRRAAAKKAAKSRKRNRRG